MVQLGDAGDQLFDADLGRLIGRAVGRTGAGAGNGAAGGEHYDVSEFLLSFSFFGVCCRRQKQKEGQSARDESFEGRFHYFLSSSETVLMQVHLETPRLQIWMRRGSED